MQSRMTSPCSGCGLFLNRSLACLAHMVAGLPMRRAEEPLTVVTAANAVVARRSETVLAALREPGLPKARRRAPAAAALSRVAMAYVSTAGW